MKIVLATGISAPEIGGPATFVKELAGFLVRRGDTVTIVTYGDEKTEKIDGANLVVIPRSGGALLRYLRYALAIRREAKSFAVVFVQGAVSEGFPGTMGARLAGVPVVMRVPGDYAWEMYQQQPNATELLDEFVTHAHSGAIRILERIERHTSHTAKIVAVPSEYLKEIVRQWGVPSDRIRVILSATPPLPAIPSRGELRNQFGVAERVVIFSAVRAVPWKGGDFLCDVLSTLPASHLLVIAGDGPCLEDWKRHATERGVADRVRFLGRVRREEIARWYAAADVFALATGYEGFPHVVAEAVSVGLPCVVSDKGGNPETKTLFPQHVTVAPYRDAEAWRAALLGPFHRLNPVTPTPFDEVAERYRALLSSVCAS